MEQENVPFQMGIFRQAGKVFLWDPEIVQGREHELYISMLLWRFILLGQMILETTPNRCVKINKDSRLLKVLSELEEWKQSRDLIKAYSDLKFFHIDFTNWHVNVIREDRE